MGASGLRARLAGGDFIVSGWSSMRDVIILERLLQGPFGAVAFDMQHGMHDEASVAAGIQLAAHMGTPAIVRVPVDGYPLVSRVLDFGAAGVILPMIETAEDARRLVAVAKYPPLGSRSYGPTRAVQLHRYASGAEYFQRANHDTLAFAMIETPAAYAALDEILAVEGLDGVFIGPSDLSIALSGGRLDHAGQQVQDAIADIAARARDAGKFTALYVFDAPETRRARALGCDLVTISSDLGIFGAGLKALSDTLAD